MPTTYRKTAKGTTEIETRVHRLPPRARSVLILVDGKRDIDALLALVPQQGQETLQSLLTQGFIETLPEAAPPPPAAPVPAPPPAADLATLRRNLARALNDALGPAAETMAIKVERARSLEELAALLPQAVQVVGGMRGRATAEAFAARFKDIA